MKQFFWRFFKITFISVTLLLTVVTLGVAYYIEFQLPDTEALNTIQLQVPLKILTQDGKLIAEYGEQRRIPLPFDQIPPLLIQAVLATEDQRYYQHPGIDIPGLLRATLQLVVTGRKEQGGSTITMQVARSFYLNRHKTFGRKLREILLALKIDHTLSKQKILELYLNKIFLGNRAYGVEAAAEVYYGKPLKQLTIDQYAMLAGLPKAPSTLNPLANPTAAKKRRDHVLARMLEQHYIDAATYNKAIKAPVYARYHELPIETKAPYAAEVVRQQLEEMYGSSIYTDGFTVFSTVNSRLQEFANQAVHNNLLAYDQRHGYRGTEGNLGKPDLSHLMAWQAKLQRIPAYDGIEPAGVIEIADKSVTVLRANGSIAVINWDGLTWARRQINADYLGRLPQQARDILKLGDIVRIMATNTGWRLAQIPKAEAAIVALSPQDGKIIALVGGFDYQLSKFNRITNAQRQPGSSFKPFIYSAALDKGFTLATVVNDAPLAIENPYDDSVWRPQNDTRHFYGPTRLREAIVHSRNLVSIRVLGMVGIPYAIKYAKRFGFAEPQLPPGLSLALGTATVPPLQLAGAYAVFANGGFKVEPYIIDNVQNNDGKIIYQAKPLVACSTCNPKENPDNSLAPRTVTAQNAYLITSALHDVIEHGTAIDARNLHRNDLAGKTGTTNNQFDAWFAGYNSDLVAISWMGFDQPQSLHEYGSKAALPLWMEFMRNALKGEPEHTLEQPPGIVSIRIDPLTGERVAPTDPTAIFEYFMEPYLPREKSNDAPPETDAAGGATNTDAASVY